MQPSDKFEFHVDEKLRPTIERKLTGTTPGDLTISQLPLATVPSPTKYVLYGIRLYRKTAPASLRNKCVFEPSCSHYSELAYRQHGLLRGTYLTIRRLRRCKPSSGGIDYSFLKKVGN